MTESPTEQKETISYAEAERLVLGSPLFVRAMGAVLAFIVLGSIGWVVTTLNKNTDTIVEFREQQIKEMTALQVTVSSLNDSVGGMKSDFKEQLGDLNTRVRSLEDKMAAQGGPNDPWYLVVNGLQVQLSDLKEQMRSIKGLSEPK